MELSTEKHIGLDDRAAGDKTLWPVHEASKCHVCILSLV